MPTLLRARAPAKLPKNARFADWPRADTLWAIWILRARMIVRSWEGLRTTVIADELGCHPQTARERGPESL